MHAATLKTLPRAVIALGFVSFFTDLSSEMIYPLIPVFLSTVLGAGALSLGIIEGVAESTASILKVVSGVWSDRMGRRKPLILGGYSLSSMARPLIGLASVWPMVLVLRFFDRVGKGLRTSPRDALIADVTHPSIRGRAYGLHRAMDHAGAVVGPLVAAALLFAVTMRQVFLLAAIPAAVVVVIIILFVKEPRNDNDKPDQSGNVQAATGGGAPKAWRGTSPLAGLQQEVPDREASSISSRWMQKYSILGRDYRKLLVAILVFTLGNSTDAFLLLRLNEVGIGAGMVAVLWSLHHGVKMISTYSGGRLSDRFGAKGLILAGWVLYAAVYLAFALVRSEAGLVAVFLVYGLYFGLTEPAEKSWISRLVPEDLRGTAFGFYNGAIGIAALPASLIFGLVWHEWNASIAFITGSCLALAAALLLLGVGSKSASGQLHSD